MAIKSKGFVLTNSYQQVYDGSLSSMFEVWNEGTGDANLIIGKQPLDDSNSKVVAAGDNWYTIINLNVPVYAKGTGKLLVIADQE